MTLFTAFFFIESPLIKCHFGENCYSNGHFGENEAIRKISLFKFIYLFSMQS